LILDIFSRCVVGWMLAARESAGLAEQLIADTLSSYFTGTTLRTVTQASR
jgi:putative transposase